MRIVDLTRTIPAANGGRPTVERYLVPLSIQGGSYQGVCYRIAMNGMSGTYLDFPGHIECFDDGVHAGNARLADLVMAETTVIHLAVEEGRREVTAGDLEGAGIEVRGAVLIVHALGEKSAADFTPDTIPYYGKSAIEWIVSKRIRVFASDIYENVRKQQGVFVELFRRGISTVCCPTSLQELRETYPRSCVVPLAMESVTQLPCRFFVIEAQ